MRDTQRRQTRGRRLWVGAAYLILLTAVAVSAAALTGQELAAEILTRNRIAFDAIELPWALEHVQPPPPGRPRVIIALIDTGISPDVQRMLTELGMFIGGTDIQNGGSDLTDTVNHGTRTASQISVLHPLVEVLIIKADTAGLAEIRDGIDYALRVAEQEQAKLVINISGNIPIASFDAATLAMFERDFNRSAEQAVIVATSGNQGEQTCSVPGMFSSVLGVGATVADTSSIWGKSNYGPSVDIYAPGAFTVFNNTGRFSTVSGTSGAAPIVSMLAALVLTDNPLLTPQQVREIITAPEATLPFGSGEKSGRVINFRLALEHARTRFSSCSGFTITRVDWGKGCVTISNGTQGPLDLQGWRISDGSKSFTFPESLVVEAGQSFALCAELYNPSGSWDALRIGWATWRVLLYSPDRCGGDEVSVKRQ